MYCCCSTTTTTNNNNNKKKKLITSDVPVTKPEKHPGRVVAGKRVAELIQQTCSRRKKKQQQQQKQQDAPTPKPEPLDKEMSTNNNNGNKVIGNNDNDNNNSTSGYFILGVGGLLISAFGVYYQREALLSAIGYKQKKSEEETNKHITPAPQLQNQKLNLAFEKWSKNI